MIFAGEHQSIDERDIELPSGLAIAVRVLLDDAEPGRGIGEEIADYEIMYALPITDDEKWFLRNVLWEGYREAFRLWDERFLA